MSNAFIHPGLFFFFGMAILPFLRGIPRNVVLIAIPLAAFISVLNLKTGIYLDFDLASLHLIFGRVDKMALLFANVFTLMAILGSIYGMHLKDSWQLVAAWGYVGSGLGCVLAGDYLTLFLFWEGLMVTSVCLVFLRAQKESIYAGYRYFLVHTAGGLLLLAGIFMLYHKTGSLSFEAFSSSKASWATYLIMAGFLLNAAVPPLHAWLPDAYGSATVVGSVFMCAYTTKTAVYALARAFPGFEILIILGVIMSLYGVVYAVLENDARRLLSYHIISQVGYMVTGVGIGTAMSLNGTCAHAYAHILYKALLFMGVGAVLHVTGRSKFTQLGGLWRFMPYTFLFTLVGGLSISAFPGFSGFVSKSMVIAGAWQSHLIWAALGLTLASAGTFLHTGLKVPYFIWFWKEKPDFEPPKKEAPLNMQIAMGLTAFLCIFIGIFPGALYALLPFEAEYHPYTLYHVMESWQILLFTMLGFFLLIKKLYPEPLIGLDLDWFYRKGAKLFFKFCKSILARIENGLFMNIHQSLFLPLLKLLAAISSWNDQRVVDGVVDGGAKATIFLSRRMGQCLQSGLLYRYLAAMLAVLAMMVGVTVWLTKWVG